MPPSPNLIGRRFGKLTVVKRLGANKLGKVEWACRCDCGNETKVTTGNLTSGCSTACPCQRKASVGKLTLSHGVCVGGAMDIYYVWVGMLARCYNPEASGYHRYGGRGITVCEQWRNDAAQFKKDMGARPKGHVIDRIDNDKGYSPENCRWVSRTGSSRNRRNTAYLTYQGKTLPRITWAELFGIPHATLRGRLSRGWPIAKALTK